MKNPRETKMLKRQEIDEGRDSYNAIAFGVQNCLIALGVLSNLFVCVVLLRYWKKKRKTKTLSNFFILQLSITDLVFRGIGIFTITADQLSGGVLSRVQCQIIMFLQYTCAAVIFVFLALIAFDRFKHIVHPLKSYGRKHRRFLYVGLVWGYAIMISIAFIKSATTQSSEEPRGPSPPGQKDTSNTTDSPPFPDCLLGQPGSLFTQIAVAVFFICGFLIPLVVMVTAYTETIILLWKLARQNLINSAIVKSKLRVTFTLIAVVASFIASWGPLMVFDLERAFRTDRPPFRLGKYPARPILLCICYTSSIINPIIYGFGNSNFREMTRDIFCRKRPSRVFPQNISLREIKRTERLRENVVHSTKL